MHAELARDGPTAVVWLTEPPHWDVQFESQLGPVNSALRNSEKLRDIFLHQVFFPRPPFSPSLLSHHALLLLLQLNAQMATFVNLRFHVELPIDGRPLRWSVEADEPPLLEIDSDAQRYVRGRSTLRTLPLWLTNKCAQQKTRLTQASVNGGCGEGLERCAVCLGVECIAVGVARCTGPLPCPRVGFAPPPRSSRRRRLW